MKLPAPHLSGKVSLERCIAAPDDGSHAPTAVHPGQLVEHKLHHALELQHDFVDVKLASQQQPAYLREYPHTHAIITFAEDVHGPVALGAGRHIGLGLFGALE
jgi:CRISPR-associated protein Csb2